MTPFQPLGGGDHADHRASIRTRLQKVPRHEREGDGDEEADPGVAEEGGDPRERERRAEEEAQGRGQHQGTVRRAAVPALLRGTL